MTTVVPDIDGTLPHTVLAGVRPGPTLLVTAGVHGDEYEGMAAVRRLRSTIAAEALSGTLVLVPVVNRGAFVRNARTGDDGLDLARVCPGDAAGTATLRAASAVSALIAASDFYIDLHSGGVAMRILPLCGYALHPDAGILAAQRRMAHAFGLPLIWGTTATLDGRTVSVARDARVPAIYAEWGGGGACDASGVAAYVDGCLRVMRSLGMLAEAPGATVMRPTVVEDDRRGSGHIQVCHPSPIDGFFAAEVELGQTVRRGQCIGTVCDELGRDVQRILASHDGLVAVLHGIPHVSRGEGVAVVIELCGAAA
jgi:predicted deacylase